MDNSSENKRIAKNSFYLYLRMFVLLLVGLFTSRVTLIALGVSDYGINNVVAGIVSMFVFINYAMINSTQRYITYELGQGDMKRLNIIFSTSLNIHAIISIIIVVLSETVGLWFLYNKMVIPPDRMNAAFWIFQLSIISCVVGIMSVPYDALIVAHERMSAFAYISLLDALFRLIIVFLLTIYDGDRLILFGILVLIVSIIDRIIYGQYCLRKFPESKYHFTMDRPLTKDMTKFAMLNLLGNLSWVCYTQGLNLLLNVFFNPVVNAARGLSVTIQTVISNFSVNIENSIKPQITKSYAQNNLPRMHQLICASARMSFFVLLLISLPILLEIEQILDIWLAEVPAHTANFVRFTILILLTDAWAAPLLTAVQATGNLKVYQLTVSLLNLLILPLSYISLLVYPKPEIVFVICLIIAIITQFLKLVIVGRQIHLSLRYYLRTVFVRTLIVALLSSAITIPLQLLFESNIVRLFFLTLCSCIVVIILIWLIGINREERYLIQSKVRSYISCKYHR